MSMPQHFHLTPARCLLALAVAAGLPFFTEVQAAGFPWRFTIRPAGAVYLAVSVNMDYYPIERSRTLSVPAGANVFIDLAPDPGYSVQKVTDNGADVTTTAALGLRYSAVNASHNIVVTLTGSAVPPPTGSFQFRFPDPLPAGLSPIYFLGGHYQGILANLQDRSFGVDVAMDETGQLDFENLAVQGLDYQPGDLQVGGKVQTVGGQPQVSVNGKIAGSFDGKPLTARCGARAAFDPHDIGAGVQGISGSGRLTGKYDGVPHRTGNTAVSLPLSQTGTRDWSLQLDLVQKANDKGRQKIFASAQLNLPNGERVEFAERVVKFSKKRGYNLHFRNGTNTILGRVDRKTRLDIGKLLFDTSGSSPVPNGGTLSYGFLGQKGKGELVDFLTGS